MDSTQLVILAGLGIGLAYGAVGLLSGFCLMSSMRGFIAEGDGRLVRTYALAIAVAIVASQFLAGNGTVDLTRAIYLQPTFSVPVLFLGGLLFGYGMVLSNGRGWRRGGGGGGRAGGGGARARGRRGRGGRRAGGGGGGRGGAARGARRGL